MKEEDSEAATHLSNRLLTRHVEQNTLVLASAAASGPETYHFAEKRGA